MIFSTISHEEMASFKMKKTKEKDLMKKKDDDFLRTELTFAFVLHASVADIQKVKECLSSLDDLEVVYQRASAGKLFICEEKEA